jgi:hypothetical protein
MMQEPLFPGFRNDQRHFHSTTTKMDGTFSLTVPASAKTLVISAVGLTAEEFGITDKSEVIAMLITDKKKPPGSCSNSAWN